MFSSSNRSEHVGDDNGDRGRQHPILGMLSNLKTGRSSRSRPVSMNLDNQEPSREKRAKKPSHTSDKLLTVNVGGTCFTFIKNQLKDQETTRLGRISTAIENSDYETVGNECDCILQSTEMTQNHPAQTLLYFNRCTSTFLFVEEYHKHGTTHFASSLPHSVIRREAEFWGIPIGEITFLATKDQEVMCTLSSPQPRRSTISYSMMSVPQMSSISEESKSMAVIKKKKPVAKMIGYITAFVGLIAVVVQALETLKAFRLENCLVSKNDSAVDSDLVTAVQELDKMKHSHWLLLFGSEKADLLKECYVLVAVQIFASIQLVCLAWFIVYYILMLITVPNKLKFIKSLESVILVIVIVPAALELIFSGIIFAQGVETLNPNNGMFIMVHMLRTLKALRTLLVIHVLLQLKSTRRMVKVLVLAAKELVLFALFALSLALIFSAVIYEVEITNPNTKFTSIPQSMWWAVVTLTTVGYGDIVPISPAGQFFASIIILISIVCLALPLTIVMNKVKDAYEAEKDREEEAAPMSNPIDSYQNIVKKGAIAPQFVRGAGAQGPEAASKYELSPSDSSADLKEQVTSNNVRPQLYVSHEADPGKKSSKQSDQSKTGQSRRRRDREASKTPTTTSNKTGGKVEPRKPHRPVTASTSSELDYLKLPKQNFRKPGKKAK